MYESSSSLTQMISAHMHPPQRGSTVFLLKIMSNQLLLRVLTYIVHAFSCAESDKVGLVAKVVPE